MFDFSWGEIVLIGVVALIFIGPKELPAVLRTAGQWMTRIRRMASEFQGQFQEALREAEMADLKKQVDELSQAARSVTNPASLAFSGENKPAPSAQTAVAPSEPARTTESSQTAPASEPPSAEIPGAAEAPMHQASAPEQHSAPEQSARAPSDTTAPADGDRPG
jgi:sec-independent protein translocase protein TatB